MNTIKGLNRDSEPEPIMESDYALALNATTHKVGDLPLKSDHICFDKGHSMYPVYALHNHQSSYGQNKCGRCGWEENWQYDYEGSNPMYYKIP